MNDLEGDGALEPLVESGVDRRHAALGDTGANAVAPVYKRTEKGIGDRGIHWLRVYGW
ncbi:hypothetical protein Dsi01nite_089470 [Dactylosporangium siamense]|uniref:Uncharacterized protein n=1 Tax=Dactylosporangium siamense TaxID=685454 RepID=A0A919UG52_9ACTN|nr:hypothetical protein Dsi01nite_089470 [Dactylosporangium siamense]